MLGLAVAGREGLPFVVVATGPILFRGERGMP